MEDFPFSERLLSGSYVITHLINEARIVIVSIMGFKEVSPGAKETSTWNFQALDQYFTHHDGH